MHVYDFHISTVIIKPNCCKNKHSSKKFSEILHSEIERPPLLSILFIPEKEVTSTFILVGLSPPQCGMTRQYSNYQYLCKDLATHRYPHVTPPRTRRTVFLSTRWTWSFKFFLSCCYARVRLQISLQNIITPHPWMETTSRSTGLTMLHRTWCTLHSRWKRRVG